MTAWLRVRWAVLICLTSQIVSPAAGFSAVTNFWVKGVVREIRNGERQVVIAHEDIPQFMKAMTMPFDVRETNLLSNLSPGQKVVFQLHVTENDSWIDSIKQLGPVDRSPNISAMPSAADIPQDTKAASVTHSRNPLRNYKFTNELGQAVSLNDFRGQALAITFFFTRCPIPQYCPRLSKNFEETQQKLQGTQNAPTNWHLLSVTFDPANDTPKVLKAYGQVYSYDPAHWSFLTGPQDKIAEFARLCDVKYDPENALFNHNFRTLIIDASNRVQKVFPITGDLSDSIVQELLRAMEPAGTKRGNRE